MKTLRPKLLTKNCTEKNGKIISAQKNQEDYS
jgi:hypothetical protein